MTPSSALATETIPVQIQTSNSEAGGDTAATEVRPTLATHGWFSVIWIIYLIDYADRFAVSAVLPAIKAEFTLSDTQLGLLSGSLFLGLALLAVPCGIAVDRFSRKYMIAAMTLVWSIATWSTGLTRSLGELLLARFFVGAGEAGYNPAGYALIAAWYPRRWRGTMVGLFQMAQPLGTGLGIMLAGHLAATFGWRAVFGILAVPGILLALVMLFAPDYKTKQHVQGEARPVRPGLGETLRFIAGNRTLQWIYLAQLPITGYIMCTGIWGPTFFMRQYGLTVAEAASAVGMVTIIAGFGALSGGWLSDRVSRNNSRNRISVCLLYLGVPLVFQSIAVLGSLQGLPWIAFVLCYGFGQFFLAANWGTLVAAGLDLSPPHFRASAQGFLPMFQGLAAVAAGILSGVLSDRIGLTHTLFMFLVVGMITGFVLLLLALRSYVADQKRAAALGDFQVDLS